MSDLKELSEQQLCDKAQAKLESAKRILEEAVRRNCSHTDKITTRELYEQSRQAGICYRKSLNCVMDAILHGVEGVGFDPVEVKPNFGSK